MLINLVAAQGTLPDAGAVGQAGRRHHGMEAESKVDVERGEPNKGLDATIAREGTGMRHSEKRGWLWLAASAALVALMVSLPAHANAQTITLCVNSNGLVKGINLASCPSNLTTVSWQQFGPTGPAGATGPAGPLVQGAQGPIGPIGMTGADGTRGRSGRPGRRGACKSYRRGRRTDRTFGTYRCTRPYRRYGSYRRNGSHWSKRI